MQGGIDVSASMLSPTSVNALSDGSWNAIVSGNGFVKPWSGATSQGAGTGSRKMVPFGNTWGGIKDYQYANKTFTAPTNVGTNQVTVTNHGYVTGLSCSLTKTGASFPTGLAASTIYYIVVVNANTLSFATTLANAVAASPTLVPITSATGSSTVTINVATSAVTASGSWMQDIGLSRWGIGAGQPHIEGTSVPGYTLSTNLQVQIATNGVFGVPVQAGLAQPSAPTVGIIDSPGSISNSMSCKIARSRPATGAVSVASPTSAVIVPQAQKIRVTFPAAATGQTHWRAYFPFQGFGGVGVHYLGSYNGQTDIPESVVAAGTVAGSAAQASGTLTFGSNPADLSTIVVNGVTITFATAPIAGQVQIGSTSTETATNLANTLGASAEAGLIVASYTASSTVVTILYNAYGTAGNAFTLANSSDGSVTRSGATLSGGVQGDFTRSLEFNFKDGDLIPVEASYDDYAPPAATHAIRLNTVMNLAGCLADSTSNPTTTNTGTAIAVSKENNYESYVPTSLLYLPEQVVDVLARPLDDYGYIGCQNSIHAIQYVGNRGDELPSCTITTILPDIGIQYMHNWCHFRGQLLIYTAQGNLILIDENGAFDTSFANPVTKILRTFTTASTAVGYDPLNDSIVVMSGKQMLVYSIQKGQWRQIWLPDFSISGTCLPSCTVSQRKLYFSMTSGGVNTAYTYDTGAAVAPLSFVSNYQNAGGVVVNDAYEMAIAAETLEQTTFAVAINRDLTKTVFRQVSTISGDTTVTTSDDSFTSNMVGKRYILFGTNIAGALTVMVRGTITAFNDLSSIEVSLAPSATLTDILMFVGDFTATHSITGAQHLPNFFPNLAELRSYQVACWMKASGNTGNVLTVDLLGTVYASSRAL